MIDSSLAALRRIALVGLLAPLLLAVSARALTLEGEVVQVRDGRAHVRLSSPVRVRIGAEVQVQNGSGAAKTVVLALSSKFLVIDLKGGLQLGKGDKIALTLTPLPAEPAASGGGGAAGADEGASEGEGEGGGATSPVQIGRKAPGSDTYYSQPIPPREKVAYKGRRPGAAPRPAPAGPGGGQSGQSGTPAGQGDGPAGPRRLEANQVRGDVEGGIDAAYDDDAGVHRVTPYARLRLEVRRLGGSDRARFTFNGSIRHDIDGNEDWTGNNAEQLNARLSQMELAIDALPEGQVQGFMDRIELGIGRMTIPDVVEAYVVDGVRMGVRAGPLVFFGFGGWGASPNPQKEDYDSLIFGGGARFAASLAHEGAIRLSLAAAQELFRGEKERQFLEANLDARYGAFGVRGSLVLDFFEQQRDDSHLRLTTGALSIYWQLSASARLEAGFRERRPVWQADLVSIDGDRTATGTELDPIAQASLERGARRNGYLTLSFDLPKDLDLWLRAEVLQSEDNGRDAAGGAVGLAKNDLFAHDRLSFELAVRRRQRGAGEESQSTDPFASLTYSYMGETVNLAVSIYYRASIPDEAGDSRIGGRGSLDLNLTKSFSIRSWLGIEVRDDEDDTAELIYGGLGLRYRF